MPPYDTAATTPLVSSPRDSPSSDSHSLRAFEFVRISCCFAGIGLGYGEYYRLFSALTVFSLAGLPACESLFMGSSSAKAKGWSPGSPYQTQSACNNLAAALTEAILLGISAPSSSLAAVTLVVFIFCGLSSINHFMWWLQQEQGSTGNGIHLCRAVGSAVLLGAAIPVLFLWRVL